VPGDVRECPEAIVLHFPQHLRVIERLRDAEQAHGGDRRHDGCFNQTSERPNAEEHPRGSMVHAVLSNGGAAIRRQRRGQPDERGKKKIELLRPREAAVAARLLEIVSG